ncbi:MAG: alpha/beta hydrolase [Flavobacteriaceae bacterium]|nr:alpha/beta hydrolase [Flavobacteriaceae bacterium]
MDKKNISLSNGETLYYLDKGNHNNVLVLVHGNMSSSIHFSPIIDDLLQDYRLIIPDLRGFGDSSYNTHINNLEDFGDDIFLLLDDLNVKEFSLLGWSTGGAITLKMAANRPKAVKKLVLLESASYRGYPIFKKDKNGTPIVGEYYNTKKDLSQDPIQVLPMVNALIDNDKSPMVFVWDQFIYTVNKPSRDQADLFISETMKQRNLIDVDWALTTFNMSDSSNGVITGDGSIKNITCPVLSIWSEKDIIIPEYMIDETVDALKNVQKVVLKDAGHNPLIDCPEKVILQIRKFIS